LSTDVLGVIAPHPPIMVPEVGGTRAHVTADSARAMRAAAEALSEFAPETVIVMSPHAPVARDAFAVETSTRLSGDLSMFGAPEVRLDTPGDEALASAVLDAANEAGIPALGRDASNALRPGDLDHGVLVPMSFLDREGRYPLLVLSLSFLPLATHAAFGQAVRAAASAIGRRVAFVASGDCSHRLTREAPGGFSPRAAEFDAWLVERVAEGDLGGLVSADPVLQEEAGECGLRSFVTLGGFLEGTDAETRLLAYEGPWGVGYLTALSRATPHAGLKGGSPGDDESPPVTLARRTIESYVRTGSVAIADPGSDPLLSGRAGTFVSLHRGGELRGCIGTIVATQPTLADEIAHNAVQAATRDPRFPPLTERELADLDISVDVLHEAEPVQSLEALDPHTYGVIVSRDLRRGLLLPDLEGVDTALKQVEIARRKAGIGPDEPVRLERFKVDRYL